MLTKIDDQESEYYWLQFSDFYQWPHIVYFDDIPDLERKLESADFNKMHDLMVLENEKRKETLMYNWYMVQSNQQDQDRTDCPQELQAGYY